MAGSLNTSGRAVAKNAISAYATLFLGALLGFILTPILIERLGASGFGTWSLILGCVAYLGLLDLGLGIATITRIAATEVDGPEAMSRVLSAAMALAGAVCALAIVAAAGLCAVFPALFNIPDRLSGDAQVAFLLVAGWQCVTFAGSVYTACLLGTGRMYLVNLSGFVVSSLVSVAQLVILLAGGGLTEIGAALLVGSVVTLMVFRYQVRRTLPALRLRPGRVDPATARHLVSLGWRNSVTSVASTLSFGSDIVLVGLILNPVAAAAYAVALRVYVLLHRITTGALGALGPTHAHAARNATAERRFELYCVSLGVSLFLALLTALTVGTYAGGLLDLWIGDVPGDAPLILMLLCAGLALQPPGFTAYLMLLNSEKASALMRITVTAAVFNIATSVTLTLLVGVIGPAIGSLLTIVLFDTVYLPWRICTMLGQHYSDIVRRVFVPIWGPLVLFGGVLIVGRLLVSDGAGVVVGAAVAASTFVVAWWFSETARAVRRILRPVAPAPPARESDVHT